MWRLPRLSGKESTCQCNRHRRCGFDLWVWISWRKKRQPIPGFWPGKSHGQRSLVGYSPWSCKEWDTTQRLSITEYKQYVCSWFHATRTWCWNKRGIRACDLCWQTLLGQAVCHLWCSPVFSCLSECSKTCHYWNPAWRGRKGKDFALLFLLLLSILLQGWIGWASLEGTFLMPYLECSLLRVNVMVKSARLPLIHYWEFMELRISLFSW